MFKYARLVLFASLCVFRVCKCELVCEKALSYLGCTASSENNALRRGLVSDDADIKYISLVGCKLVSLQEESFEGLPSLETLDVSSNGLATVALGVLDNLNSVQTFNLSFNAITQLPLGIFDQMTSLTYIDLSNNQISAFELGTFDPTVYLRTLYLDHNSLQGLPLGIFDKARGLVELDLSFNDMSTIPLGIFDTLPQLRIVDMSFTNCANMPSGIFDENGALTDLSLSGNGLKGLPHRHLNSLQRLENFDVSRNLITELRVDLFEYQTNLKHLNLSSNLLRNVTAASALQRLHTLDLSKNKLSVLPAFNLPLLNYLDVSDNRLTNFGANVGMNIPKKLKVFKLHKNPWQCACLEQVLGLLRRRRVQYEFSPYFEGKKPVCLIAKNKVSRCFRDNSQDQVLHNQYTNSLMKYPA